MDKVVHFEIPADDLARAQKFYRGTFGWEIKEVPDMDYYIVTTVASDEKGMPETPGAINGGMMKRMDEKAPIIVINVASIEDSLKEIENAGGKVIMPPQQIGDFGMYARFADTEGNLLGIWQDLKK